MRVDLHLYRDCDADNVQLILLVQTSTTTPCVDHPDDYRDSCADMNISFRCTDSTLTSCAKYLAREETEVSHVHLPLSIQMAH